MIKDIGILLFFCAVIIALLMTSQGLDNTNNDKRIQECKEKHGFAEINNRGFIRACIIKY